jgi:CheY-like chemotaxis protein
MDDDRLSAFNSGADDFLTKPCSENDLPALSAERIGQLPQVLIEEIRNATLKGNKKLLDMLILQVAGTGDTGCAGDLQALADKYEYDTLTKLLEEACPR